MCVSVLSRQAIQADSQEIGGDPGKHTTHERTGIEDRQGVVRRVLRRALSLEVQLDVEIREPHPPVQNERADHVAGVSQSEDLFQRRTWRLLHDLASRMW